MFALVTLSSVIADSRPGPDEKQSGSSEMTGIRLITPRISDETTIPWRVVLEDFSGGRTGNAVQLEWTTSHEVQNQGFEVQRASSGSHGWERLTFIPGIGQSDMEQRYLFDDRNAPPEDLRYMLRILGIDGTIQYSRIISVPAGSVLRSFIISSSAPAYAKLYEAEIELDANVPVTLHLLDYAGNILVRTLNASELSKGMNTIQIDCSKLPSGSYEAIVYTPHERFSRTLTIK
ncbi:MAG: hypothetical protein C0600_01165 [Ignavibacteria bacterium]|nr:MAG: hypothetical protein C0600_01165 [Ignavibacteria bacterium]